MPLDSENKTIVPTEFKTVGTRPVRPDGMDKVTGRARFGADMSAPGMLVGAILRSPHAHARIRKIDTSKAEALAGVKAVITSKDLKAQPGCDMDILVNVMARGKALYDGHAVAAVAAVDMSVARKALKLIEIDYKVLPHVTDVDEAMKPDAPVLHKHIEHDYHQDMLETADHVKGKNEKTLPPGKRPSNIAGRYQFGHGDPKKGFREADVIVEHEFKTEATHQGYIEPHACLANVSSDGWAELWVCTQGHFMVRDTCASLLGLDVSRLRVTASEIGGGFGGKTTVFIEPVALALSRKAGRPVKVVMSRDEVFRATGPTSSASMKVRIGAKRDGTFTAAEAILKYQGGAFPGSPVEMGAMTAFACYDLKDVKIVGYDVVTNRPKQAAYRAPGAPMSAFAVEGCVGELAEKLGMDAIDIRLKNAAKEGTVSSYGPTFGPVGLVETLEAAKKHKNYKVKLGKNQGRGVASGFWFNFAGQTCTTINLNIDGTLGLAVGTPDIGGSRASMCLMAAEELGIPYDQVRTIIADTSSLGYNDVTDGSRVTFASGLATIYATRDLKAKLCARAATIWGIPEEAVDWENGAARPAGANAGNFDPLTLADLAEQAAATGGPVAGHYEVNADGAGPSFATHVVDVEVDPETGATEVLRYLVVQDAGKAVHPSYVEGQFQGGAVQGIGWVLNEEYIYGEDGRLQNPGFLDYRIPVCSDVPMIDTVIVEVPNPGHPYGVRGVGETSIVPPLAAVANAVSAAMGVRATTLPMSPPKILAALNNKMRQAAD
ncbi:MAG: xanthine dehydrogenase family protein molybdopterin-binding subunit [Pseudomonadota bacterium]